MTPLSFIIEELEDHLHKVSDGEERAHTLETINFIRHTPDAFARENTSPGHVGASAVVIDSDATKILLTQHTVLKTWAFFGNHADGNLDLHQVARNRIAKDSSPLLAEFSLLVPPILDVDIHEVPPHTRHGADVPAHLHYDIAYLFVAPQAPQYIGVNSQWFLVNDLRIWPHTDSQFQRIIQKVSGLR